MATIAPLKPAVAVFPKGDVVAALTAELIDVARSEAQVRGIALPPDAPKVIKAAVPLDSLSVVDTLCALEPVVGFELRDQIVRTGGYDSIEAALDHLVPRIERAWIRKKGPKP
jgi:hypothetical protein